MSIKKPTKKRTPKQAQSSRIALAPLPPSAEALYHDFLEITVWFLFTHKAIEYLRRFARQKAGKLSGGWKMRMGTVCSMSQCVQEAQLTLHPHDQRQSRASKGEAR